MTFPTGTTIIGIGSAVPKTIVTNSEIETLVDTTDDWIVSRTGIKERRIANSSESCASLASESAIDALNFAGLPGSCVDLIIVATSTPDHLYPSTACLVQSAIGATRAAAFDLGAACTGMIYALTVGQHFIAMGTYKTVMVIGVDIHSRFIDWQDRNSCILFGDGAGAFLLQASDTRNDVLSTHLRSDGEGAQLLSIPNSGTGYAHGGVQESAESQRFVKMNGKAIYEFAISAIPDAVNTACTKAGIRTEQIDFLISHQANKRIILSAAKKLNIAESKLVMNIERFGNTSAASIPLAFTEAVATKQITQNSNCVLVGFGAGLTWGAVVIRWTAQDQRRL